MTATEEPEIAQSSMTSEIAAEDLQKTMTAEAKDDMNGTTETTLEAVATRAIQPKRPNYHKLHARPMPLSVYPIPNFFPHQPLSLLRIAYLILRDWVFPPSLHTTIYSGYLSAATQSVHVTEPATVRALWEMGFFGTGTLSRSEPNWLHLERRRLGLVAFMTAEEVTAARRNVRMEFKRERARLEREELEEQKRKEAAGALGLLSPPVSDAGDISVEVSADAVDISAVAVPQSNLLPSEQPHVRDSEADRPQVKETALGTIEAEALQGPEAHLAEPQAGKPQPQDAMQREDSSLQHVYPHIVFQMQTLCEQPTWVEEQYSETQESNIRHVYSHIDFTPQTQRELSIKVKEKHDSAHETSEDEDTQHFSIPKEPIKAVEICDNVQEPSKEGEAQVSSRPESSIKAFEKHGNSQGSVESNEAQNAQSEESSKERNSQPSSAKAVLIEDEDVEEALEPEEPTNQEHLQLSLAEAFYLSYALGALKIVDPESQNVIDNNWTLLQCFRQKSYFPPASPDQLKPDDPFMLSYAVYHHFRSLGWVVREGVKFAVDFLLYERGPVFTHATFAVMIVPSYTDAYWSATPERAKEVEKKRARKSWHWLHCANRVQGQVIKTLVLVYIDVPAPIEGGEAEKDVAKMLQRYRIREFALRRWSPNRNRD